MLRYCKDFTQFKKKKKHVFIVFAILYFHCYKFMLLIYCKFALLTQSGGSSPYYYLVETIRQVNFWVTVLGISFSHILP